MKKLTLDLTPLRESKSFRIIFLSQLISFIGSGITLVAIPFQVYEMTQSNAAVGLLGVAQLIPMIVSGLWGGALADQLDRKKLVLWSESLQAISVLLLVVFVQAGLNVIWPLYFVAGLLAFLEGFHRPALSAILPLVVRKELMPAAGALGGFRVTFSFIIAPAFAGMLLASVGLKWAYVVDFVSYVISILLLLRLKFPDYLKSEEKNVLKSILLGAQYLFKQPVILGSYLADILAMTFAYPFLLFPAISKNWGGTSALGYLHSSIWMGALFATLLSGWISQVKHHGKMISICAMVWCIGIALAGMQHSLFPALIFFGLAGAFDMYSAIFRHTLWNQAIPSQYRGRMGGIELLSFKSGPYLGGMMMGFSAQTLGEGRALWVGGIAGAFFVLLAAMWIRPYWKYKSAY